MEIVQILRRMWQLRLWLALAAVVAVIAGVLSIYNLSFDGGPKLKRKAIVYGAASAQVLVDSDRSTLADPDQDLAPLVARADAYARFMASPPIKQEIAKNAGIDVNLLSAQGPPVPITAPGQRANETTGEQRSNDLLTEGVGYNVRFQAPADLPIIQIVAQAPTVQDAKRLADASVVGLQTYVKKLEASQPTDRQSVLQFEQARAAAGIKPGKLQYQAHTIRITALGSAVGGTVNKGSDKQVAILTMIAVWIGLTIAIMLISNVIRQFRHARALERIGAAPWSPGGSFVYADRDSGTPRANGNGNSHGTDPTQEPDVVSGGRSDQ